MLSLTSAVISGMFFLLTGALLLVAHYERRYNIARAAAFSAVSTVCIANYFMLAAYRSEASAGVSYAAAPAPRPAKSALLDTEPVTGASFLLFGALSRRTSAVGEMFQDCPECPAMVTLPPGFFRLGAADDEAEARPQERPARTAKIAKPFSISRAEVSAGEFAAFVAATGRDVAAACAPGHLAGMSPAARLRPAQCISGEDAEAYVDWLSRRSGSRYRLISAVEWEYAAGLAARARVALAAAGDATAAGSGFGLVGFGGGVAEIVADCWTPTLGGVPADGSALREGDCSRRVVKDGFDGEPAARMRASARRAMWFDRRAEGVGFRIAR